MAANRPRGIRAKRARSYRDLEAVAANVRRSLGFSTAASLSGVELFERLDAYRVESGTSIARFDYAVRPLTLAVEAQTRYDPDSSRLVIELSEETYAALEAGQDRAKFSLCHEIGHGVLHLQELVALAGLHHEEAALLRGRPQQHSPCWDTEWQADGFAGALLMPARAVFGLLKGQLSPESGPTLQLALGVSAAAAEVRLRVLRSHQEVMSIEYD